MFEAIEEMEFPSFIEPLKDGLEGILFRSAFLCPVLDKNLDENCGYYGTVLYRNQATMEPLMVVNCNWR